jgi:hypothetical protein
MPTREWIGKKLSPVIVVVVDVVVGATVTSDGEGET